jgi:hypothetical protein
MNTEEFEKATEKDLRRKANDCFDKLKDSGSQEWPALLMAARFYLDEIERREHDSVARRDLMLELVVIVLIGLELYFGIAGGNAQMEALQNLNASTGQTAIAMKALAERQNAALEAIQQREKETQEQSSKTTGNQKTSSQSGDKRQ